MVSIVVAIIGGIIALSTIILITAVTDERVEALMCGLWCLKEKIIGHKI